MVSLELDKKTNRKADQIKFLISPRAKGIWILNFFYMKREKTLGNIAAYL